jgi:protein-S-isoprenylcysteine O-methyltransferase Ste14
MKMMSANKRTPKTCSALRARCLLTMMKLLTLALTLSSIAAFAPARLATVRQSKTIAHLSDTEKSIQDQLKDLTSNINLDSIMKNADAIRSNVYDGEFGTRGEEYTVTQVFLLFCILIGGVPIVGDFLALVCGPVLVLAGSAILAVSVNDLGASNSPWPVPGPSSDGLKTGGLYAQFRHPVYAGLLAVCAGVSVITGSSARLLLTAALLYSLNVKADYEEGELMKKYPEYAAYKEEVPSRFFPKVISDALPWTK